jgi:hypothetical protein
MYVLSRTCSVVQIAAFFLSSCIHMSNQRAPSSSPFDGADQKEPYRNNPTTSPPQATDISFLDIHHKEPSESPRLSFASSVSLIPTPGTASQRRPTYVRPRPRLMSDYGPSLILLFRYVGADYATISCRNRRLCSACSSGDCVRDYDENLRG